MEEQTAQKKHPTKTRKRKLRRVGPYPFELRLRSVQMYVEEGYPAHLITAEMGISGETLNKWAKLYRQSGEEGLRKLRAPRKRSPQSVRVKERILEVKKSNPSFGSRRISDILRRFFLLPASSATVHKTLPRRNSPTRRTRRLKRIQAHLGFSSVARPTSCGRVTSVHSDSGGRMPI